MRKALFPLVAAITLGSGMVHSATLAVNYGDSSFQANTGIEALENTNALNAAVNLVNPTWNNIFLPAGVAINDTTSIGTLTILTRAANPYFAGSEGKLGDDASQQVFRSYLDDGDAGGLATDGYGPTISISGLTAYLAASGASSYSVTLLLSTDSTGFRQPQIFSGVASLVTPISSLSSLGTPAAQILGNGTQPIPTGAGTGADGTRGWAVLGGLTADSITITLPATGTGRGTIAGFAITPIPEPSSVLLLGAAGTLWGLRRRRGA